MRRGKKMFKKIIFALFIVTLLFFAPVLFANGHMVNFNLSTWIQYTANGSYVKSVTPDETTLVMLRINTGPKTDVSTHGYAYLFSNPINIGDEWGKIIIEGTWWKEGKRKNYQEMCMYIFAKKPELVHGLDKDGKILTNFIYIAYDEWNKVIKFIEKGDKKEPLIHKTIHRVIPETPRKFKIVLESAYPRGEFTWEYWEKENQGNWKRLYTQDVSHLFDGLEYPFNKIYVKIGGWDTLEYPIPTKIHFKDLVMYNYTQLEVQEGITKEEQR